MPSLKQMSRAELDEEARRVGIREPESYSNIDKLIAAIEDQDTTGRPGRIEEDIERTKREKERPITDPGPDQGGDPHPFRQGQRVIVTAAGTSGMGTLVRQVNADTWAVRMDGAQGLAMLKIDQLELP